MMMLTMLLHDSKYLAALQMQIYQMALNPKLNRHMAPPAKYTGIR